MAGRARTIAVMQPYFFPYAGYFRLMAVADHFVVFDCVQFPRRGWVHRCRVPSPAGGEEWLTLPLEPCPRDTGIKDLRFAAGAGSALADRLKRFPWLASGKGAAADALRQHLASPLDDVTSFLLDGLKLVSAALGVSPEITRSSDLGLAPELRGQERVIAAARAVGGTRYVNAPGGRQLYDSRAFAEHGMELRFLSSYTGGYPHMLHALAHAAPDEIRADVLAQCELVP
jgi:hypothetical protein